MKLLVVAPRFPWPTRRGDQMRALQTCELLAEEHRVTLLVPEPGEGEAAPDGLGYGIETYAVRPAARVRGVARAALTGRPLQAGLFHQPDLARRLRELAPEADLAVLLLVRLAAHAGDLRETPFVVDLVDSLALNFERRARYDRPWLRPLLRLEARRLLAWEERLVRRAAAALLVCDRDRAWLADRLAPEAARKLTVVPLWLPSADEPFEMQTGGNLRSPEEPGASPASRRARSDSPPRLCLTGNLGYFVNADAAVHFTRTVWPRLGAAHPGLTLTLAGARPPRRVRRLARRPGVELIADAPDLAPVLAGATAAIAPLRAGSGVPVKVLEAWAAGVPVIASPWAAAGAAARPGRDLLVAASPDDWRDAVSRLLADPALGRRLATAGRARLAKSHSRAAVRRAFTAALDKIT